MDVNLVVFTSKGERKDIRLKPGRYLVGRKASAALRIPLSSVSREHCELIHEGGEVRIRDLNSSNGTYRNFSRVDEATLEPGDVLDIGGCLVTVQIDGEPAQVSPPGAPGGADDALAETPPAGSAPPQEAGDLDETVAKAPGVGRLVSSDTEEDSSIFDFDFDFEDDEKP